MKPYRLRTTIDNNTLIVELPNEFIGEDVEIIITSLRHSKVDEHNIYLKKLYDKILEKSIPAIDLTDEIPNWQKKK